MSFGACAVSVVVPVFNAADVLARCINSLRAQTLRNVQIVIVDDGSTDDSVRIASDLAARDDRIVLRVEDHVGPGHARNRGLEVATAPYVLFVDSDDWMVANACEVLVGAGSATGADIVVANTQSWRGPAFPPVEGPESTIRQLYRGKISMGVWAKLYRRGFLESHGIGFHPTMYIEDRNFLVQCIIAGARLSALEAVVYHRVLRGDSAMNRISDKHLADVTAMYCEDVSMLERAGLLASCGYCAAVATIGVDSFLASAVATLGGSLRPRLAEELARQEELFEELPVSASRQRLLRLAVRQLRAEVTRGGPSLAGRTWLRLARVAT